MLKGCFYLIRNTVILCDILKHNFVIVAHLKIMLYFVIIF